MDIKQEILHDSGSESINIKVEPLTSIVIKPIVCEINQETKCLQKVKKETENVCNIKNVDPFDSQIDQTTKVTGCLYTKNDPINVSSEFNGSSHTLNKFLGIKLKIPEISDSKVQAKDLPIEDLVIIKQEDDLNYELLTEEVDLPTIKNETDLIEPCSSQQSVYLKKNETYLIKPCSSQQFVHAVLKKNVRKKRKKIFLCPVCKRDWGSASSRLKHLSSRFGMCHSLYFWKNVN